MSLVNKGNTHNKFESNYFDYQTTKNGKVLIYWYGKHVVTLAGKRAIKFLRQVDGLDEIGVQLIMARFTGNFKRGNEQKSDKGR